MTERQRFELTGPLPDRSRRDRSQRRDRQDLHARRSRGALRGRGGGTDRRAARSSRSRAPRPRSCATASGPGSPRPRARSRSDGRVVRRRAARRTSPTTDRERPGRARSRPRSRTSTRRRSPRSTASRSRCSPPSAPPRPATSTPTLVDDAQRARRAGLRRRARRGRGRGSVRSSRSCRSTVRLSQLVLSGARESRAWPSSPAPNADDSSEVSARCRRLVDRAVDEVQRRRRDTGTMSFDDVLTQLRDALRHSPAAAASLQRRYRVALIDEFQDTDPVQWQIFSTLFGGADERHRAGARRRPEAGDLRLPRRQRAHLSRGGVRARHRPLDPRRQLALRPRRCSTRSSGSSPARRSATLASGSSTSRPRRTTSIAGLRTADGHRASRARRSAPRSTRICRAPRRKRGRSPTGEAESGTMTPRPRRAGAAPARGGAPSRREAARPGPHARVRPQRHRGARRHARRRDGDAGGAACAAASPRWPTGAAACSTSPAAIQWRWLLTALTRPSDAARARTAALSWFFGWSADRVDTASDDDLAEVQEQLYRWAEILETARRGGLLRAALVRERRDHPGARHPRRRPQPHRPRPSRAAAPGERRPVTGPVPSGCSPRSQLLEEANEIDARERHHRPPHRVRSRGGAGHDGVRGEGPRVSRSSASRRSGGTASPPPSECIYQDPETGNAGPSTSRTARVGAGRRRQDAEDRKALAPRGSRRREPPPPLRRAHPCPAPDDRVVDRAHGQRSDRAGSGAVRPRRRRRCSIPSVFDARQGAAPRRPRRDHAVGTGVRRRRRRESTVTEIGPSTDAYAAVERPRGDGDEPDRARARRARTPAGTTAPAVVVQRDQRPRARLRLGPGRRHPRRFGRGRRTRRPRGGGRGDRRPARHRPPARRDPRRYQLRVDGPRAARGRRLRGRGSRRGAPGAHRPAAPLEPGAGARCGAGRRPAGGDRDAVGPPVRRAPAPRPGARRPPRRAELRAPPR